jgi:hypothetical protein
MKKLLALVLSLVLVFGFVTLAMAATIATSGEIDLEYFSKNWTGDTHYSLTEVGVYNTMTISDSAEAHLNFWYESNSKDVQDYNLLDDAYVTYKFGANTLMVGKTRYWKLQGPTDSLSENVRNLIGGGDIFEPAVSAVATFKLADSISVEAGYFYNTLHSTGTTTQTPVYDSTGTKTGEYISTTTYDKDYEDDGFNIGFARASYTAGNLSANVEYIQLSDSTAKWISDTPAADIEADISYKLGNFSVYVADFSVDRYLRTWTAGDLGDSDNYVFVGGTASIGNLWASVDYAVTAPDDAPNQVGYKLNYYLGNNSSLKYSYVNNTYGGYQDKSELQLIVTF